MISQEITEAWNAGNHELAFELAATRSRKAEARFDALHEAVLHAQERLEAAQQEAADAYTWAAEKIKESGDESDEMFCDAFGHYADRTFYEAEADAG